jgi:hypothetical protein
MKKIESGETPGPTPVLCESHRAPGVPQVNATGPRSREPLQLRRYRLDTIAHCELPTTLAVPNLEGGSDPPRQPDAHSMRLCHVQCLTPQSARMRDQQETKTKISWWAIPAVPLDHRHSTGATRNRGGRTGRTRRRIGGRTATATATTWRLGELLVSGSRLLLGQRTFAN